MNGPNSPSFTNLNLSLAGTCALAMEKMSEQRKKRENIAEDDDILVV